MLHAHHGWYRPFYVDLSASSNGNIAPAKLFDIKIRTFHRYFFITMDICLTFHYWSTWADQMDHQLLLLRSHAPRFQVAFSLYVVEKNCCFSTVKYITHCIVSKRMRCWDMQSVEWTCKVSLFTIFHTCLYTFVFLPWQEFCAFCPWAGLEKFPWPWLYLLKTFVFPMAETKQKSRNILLLNSNLWRHYF